MLTRRSRASTIPEVLARLSKNHALLLPLTLLFLDLLQPRVVDGSESVAAFGVGFCVISARLSENGTMVTFALFLLWRRFAPARCASFTSL